MRIQTTSTSSRFIPIIALGLGIAFAGTSLAGERGVDVGMLTCESVPGSGLNLVVHSTVDIKCVFKAADGKIERYKGETGIGFGVDLSFGHHQTFHFAVLAGKFKEGTHHLTGTYGGGKVSASLGVGGGSKILVGGDHDNIGLKPAAIQSKGIGVAAGLTYMHLEPDVKK